MEQTYHCPICGYPGLLDRPRTANGGGSDEICPSCGFQFGYTDDDLGFTDEQWRAKWTSEGMPWADPVHPHPAGWDPVAQLRAVVEP